MVAKGKKRLTSKQKALLREVRHDPLASDYKISKRISELGHRVSDNYVSDTKRRNADLREKVTKLRERYELEIIKQFPAAKKVVKSHLKQNNLDAAKLVYRHSVPTLDENKRPTSTQYIQYNQIQNNIRHLVQQSQESKEKEVGMEVGMEQDMEQDSGKVIEHDES
jgi:hypothetical protein